MNLLVVSPILIPLTAAALGLMLWRWRRLQRLAGGIGAVAGFAAAVVLVATVWRERILVTELANWPAPYGIVLVADLLSSLLVLVSAGMGLLVTVYSFASTDKRREAFGYYPLFQVLIMGINGAFLTGDLFNLYVWFEVMLMASFVLLALGGERPQLEGAIKYVTLNLIASAIFLAAVGLTYGVAGTLNLADLGDKLAETDNPGLVTTLGVLYLIAFGVKAAVFPLFFWLPSSYHTPPVAVSAIFAALLTKVGVYSMVRVFTVLFLHEPEYTYHTLILTIGVLSMITGVLGAAVQSEFRRILAFHSISQIGYMVMGLGLFTPLALAGAIIYIVHHSVVKANLFLISGLVHRRQGSHELKKIGGVYLACPALGLLFLVTAMSLAGIPPFSGFFAKLALVQAGLEAEAYIAVAAALAVGLMTLYSMTKIWTQVFWEPAPEGVTDGAAFPDDPSAGPWGMVIPVAILAAMAVALGLGAEFMFRYAMAAAEQLLAPAEYIGAVLGRPS